MEQKPRILLDSIVLTTMIPHLNHYDGADLNNYIVNQSHDHDFIQSLIIKNLLQDLGAQMLMKLIKSNQLNASIHPISLDELANSNKTTLRLSTYAINQLTNFINNTSSEMYKTTSKFIGEAIKNNRPQTSENSFLMQDPTSKQKVEYAKQLIYNLQNQMITEDCKKYLRLCLIKCIQKTVEEISQNNENNMEYFGILPIYNQNQTMFGDEPTRHFATPNSIFNSIKLASNILTINAQNTTSIKPNEQNDLIVLCSAIVLGLPFITEKSNLKISMNPDLIHQQFASNYPKCTISSALNFVQNYFPEFLQEQLTQMYSQENPFSNLLSEDFKNLMQQYNYTLPSKEELLDFINQQYSNLPPIEELLKNQELYNAEDVFAKPLTKQLGGYSTRLHLRVEPKISLTNMGSLHLQSLTFRTNDRKYAFMMKGIDSQLNKLNEVFWGYKTCTDPNGKPSVELSEIADLNTLQHMADKTLYSILVLANNLIKGFTTPYTLKNIGITHYKYENKNKSFKVKSFMYKGVIFSESSQYYNRGVEIQLTPYTDPKLLAMLMSSNFTDRQMQNVTFSYKYNNLREQFKKDFNTTHTQASIQEFLINLDKSLFTQNRDGMFKLGTFPIGYSDIAETSYHHFFNSLLTPSSPTTPSQSIPTEFLAPWEVKSIEEQSNQIYSTEVQPTVKLANNELSTKTTDALTPI